MNVVEFAPFERDAKMFADQSHQLLVTDGKGGRFRFEPTPNALTGALEQGHLRGELSAAERILAALESDNTMDRETILGELHLYIMQVNNSIHSKFGVGEYIHGVEIFTQKYMTQQNENFAQ